MRTYHLLPVALAALVLGCGEDGGNGGATGTAPTPTPSATATPTPTPTVTAVNQRVVASFDNP